MTRPLPKGLSRSRPNPYALSTYYDPMARFREPERASRDPDGVRYEDAYRGPVPRSGVTRRDPARDSEVDWGKVVLGLALVAGAGFGIYKLIKSAQAATPGAPSGPSVGDDAQVGDQIAVRAAAASVAPYVPAGHADPILQVITAVPGNPQVGAAFSDPSLPGAAGKFVVVDRRDVTLVTRNVPIAPAAPGAPDSPNVAPPAPPSPPAPATAVVDLGDPVSLESGRQYRARIELSGLQATLATPDLVQGQLAGIGFQDVEVWTAKTDLPAGWPPETMVPDARGVYYAQGTWGQASQDVPRPVGVAEVWEA